MRRRVNEHGGPVAKATEAAVIQSAGKHGEMRAADRHAADQEPHRPEEREAAEKRRLEAALECGLEGTFPAADPVAVTQPAPSSVAAPWR